uniref:Uncharacterized protein n=1 Tax=Meloidogyne enterolobii TaxID=390850 RepID=A0A6V7WS66_MELEN|nr:unnamed protein product [Meloidogyne enterolobii]
MKTPKQLEEWSFSTTNSDNIKNKIGDETLVEEDNLTEKSCLETSSIDGLSTICSSSFCSTQNINGSLKQRLKKLELKLDLSLQNYGLKLQNKMQAINFDHKNEIQEIKQNFQKLIEENSKQLKAENDISLKQKDKKINYLVEEINKLHNQSDDLINLQTNFNNLKIKFIEEKEKPTNLENELKGIDKKIQKLFDETIKQLNNENAQKDEKINSLKVEIKEANYLIDKKIAELFNFNNLYFVVSLLNNMVFVNVKIDVVKLVNVVKIIV